LTESAKGAQTREHSVKLRTLAVVELTESAKGAQTREHSVKLRTLAVVELTESAKGAQIREHSVLASEIDACTEGVLIRKKSRNVCMGLATLHNRG
jgi:hypothetical protein